MAALRLLRGREVRRGVHFGKPVEAELGTIAIVAGVEQDPTVWGYSSPTLERLDGYVRLPSGVYWLRSCFTADGLRALRFEEAVKTERPLTAKQAASFYAKPHGRFYVHGATHPAHVKGCVGVVNFSELMTRLGILVRSGDEEKWNEGCRVMLEIKRDA